MKVATWNLESARPLTAARKTAFYDAIRTFEADVWILTETWTSSHLEPIAGYTVASESSRAEDLASDSERCWVSIWVKDTVTHMPVEINDHQDRLAGVLIESSGRSNMVVIGTVLPWMSDRLWPGADGFCRAVTGQSCEWTRIRKKHQDSSLLIAGDFNQSIPGISRYGSSDGVRALSSELRNQDLLCLTQGEDRLTGKPRIDHICFSRKGQQSPYLTSVTEWAVPVSNGKSITDHSGVGVELI